MYILRAGPPRCREIGHPAVCVIITIGAGPVKLSYLYAVRRVTLGSAAAAILALALATATPAQAGPWTQNRDGYYARFSASYLYTRHELDSDGNEVPLLTANPLVQDAAYREIVLFSYVEYGLTDRWTLVGALPYKILTSKRTEITELADLVRKVDVTNAGLSDLTVGVRRALVRGSRPLAIEVTGSVPMGYDRTPDNGGPALGSGYADVAAILHAGTSFGAGYASASAGYRVRGGPLSDVYGFGLQAGGGRGRFGGYALLEGWYSTVDPEPLDVSSTVAVSNQDVLKLIVSAAFQISEQAAAAADLYHVLDGRNTPTGTTVALSLVLTR